jgi:hypothetical protein
MRTFHALLSLVLIFGAPLRSGETDFSSAAGFSVGVSADFDSRDNVMYSSRAIYAFAAAHVFAPPPGSDCTYQRYTSDDEEKMDLRMDVGFGRGTSGVYVSVYQAF